MHGQAGRFGQGQNIAGFAQISRGSPTVSAFPQLPEILPAKGGSLTISPVLTRSESLDPPSVEADLACPHPPMQKGGRQIQSSLQRTGAILAAFLGAYRRKAGIVVFYFLIAHGLILNHDKFSVKPDFGWPTPLRGAKIPDRFCLENDAVLHKGTFPSGRRRIYFLHPQVPLWFETSAFRTDKPAPRTPRAGYQTPAVGPGGSHPPGARRKALKGLAANQARSEVGRKNPARRVAQSFPDAFECRVTQKLFPLSRGFWDR